MNLNLRGLGVLVWCLLFILIFLPFVSAWGGETHVRLCPDNYEIDCNVADSFEFQRNNPHANTWYHVCYDNTENCMPRLAAKYFLKRYYLEGKSDQDLLGAAAHLFQDASCPLHWYPGFKIFGQDRFLSAPRRIKIIESEVDSRLLNREEDWNIQIEFKGNDIDVNKKYLDNLKKETSEFISKEPEESIESLQSQLKSKLIWHRLRAYQDFIMLLFIIFIPILGYGVWKYKKERKISSDLIISIIVLLILVTLFIIIKLFY